MAFESVNRKQMNLLGYCVEDFVPGDAKCRFVVDLVSQLDLSALYSRYSDKGAEAKEPSAMLATWFFATANRWTVPVSLNRNANTIPAICIRPAC